MASSRAVQDVVRAVATPRAWGSSGPTRDIGQGTANFTECEFERGLAREHGGALHAVGSATFVVRGGAFVGNKAGVHGSAINFDPSHDERAARQ